MSVRPDTATISKYLPRDDRLLQDPGHNWKDGTLLPSVKAESGEDILDRFRAVFAVLESSFARACEDSLSLKDTDPDAWERFTHVFNMISFVSTYVIGVPKDAGYEVLPSGKAVFIVT